jgi:hypothetical protein
VIEAVFGPQAHAGRAVSASTPAVDRDVHGCWVACRR